MRVVASLTTMPDRYFKIVKTLESLRRQTYKLDAIYLGLPDKSRRLGIEYPPVPEEITNLCTVVPCTDFGPITKILGGLLSEDDPDTVIISFDDDMIYPDRIVELLVRHHVTYPDSALGSSGMLLKHSCPMCAITPNEDNFLYRISKFSVPPEGRRVDSIYGYPGALYVRKFFPLKHLLEDDFLNFALVDNNMLMNDDIVISGYLSLYNIERRIFPNMPSVSFVLDDSSGVRVRTDNEISYDLDKFFQRMNLAIGTAKSIGMYSVTEPLDMSESIVGVSAIIVLSLIILIFLIIYIVRSDYFHIFDLALS
jgi:hypothetical protein